MDPVLQALGAAHSAGLIHRDVKPENVILRDDGTVKVADFDLARAIATTTSTAQTGVLLGTVAYLSPEQVERGIADARSDVYAAGLLLFEMLTGSKAYIGDSPIHVAYQHVHSEVPLPSSRVSTVPAGLDSLVAGGRAPARASAREPDQRPRDANELLLEMRRTRRSLSPYELDRRPAGGFVAANPTMMLSRTAVVPQSMMSAGSGPGPAGRRWQLPDIGALRGRSWPILAIALFLVAGAAALILFFAAGPGAKTTVPTVVGTTRLFAQNALSRAHLDTRVVKSFDESVKAGVVLAEVPLAGREVSRGSTVLLTVSQGPERIGVPQLIGRTQADAEQRLKDARLTVGTVSKGFSETVAQGQVITTTPAADTAVKRDAPVAMVISQGRQPIQLADWTNQPVDQATAALTQASLKVDSSKQDWSSTVPKGSVISQSPATGTLFQGGVVTLVVSKGPQMVPVPNVISMQEQPATAILEALGFTVKVDRALGGYFGTVRLQSVDAGAEAPKGSTITLTVV
jgi:serine/threonine-protein kinase